MTKGSYWGKMIEVDMTTGTVNITDRHMQYVEEYPLGRPLGYRLLWEALKDEAPGYDRFGPKNPLMFLSGIMTGHPFPGLSRYEVMCKSGATWSPHSPYGDNAATVAHAASGSSFGAMLRWAGYDMIYVTGKSTTPKYLHINNDTVELLDASEYWGMDVAQFETAMFKKYGYQYKFNCIGPAGESLNHSAAIISEGGHAAARGGVGAVMGSKMLKGIALYGDQIVPCAKPEELREWVEAIDQKFYANAGLSNTRRWGTASMLMTSHMGGTKSTKNHSEGWDPNAATSGWPSCEQDFWVKHSSCYFCQMRCVKMGVVNRGPHKGLIAEGPEYEDAICTSNLLFDNVQDMGALMELRDALGFDTISSGGIMGFAFEAFEKGDITSAMLGDGKQLRWGNVDDARQFLKDLCYNDRDIFQWLRRGPSYAAYKIGNNAIFYSMASKNHPYAAWVINSMNASGGRAINYATTTRGACHMEGNPGTGARGNLLRDMAITCVTPNGQYNGDYSKDKVFNFLMGYDLTLDQWNLLCDRANHLAKVFNLREGFGRADDTIAPKNFEQPLTQGPEGAAWIGFKVDRDAFDAALTKLYTDNGWDPQTGIPTDGKLQELGLDYLIPVVQEIRARK